MNDARQELGVAAVEGRVYAIGGIASNQLGSNAVDIFDTRTNEWRSGPPLPIPIHHPNVAAVGSKIYVAGGYSDPGFTAVANTYELDTDTLRWTRKADLPSRRGAGAAAGLNGRLYVVGGERGDSVGDTAVYDPATDRWTALAPMPTPRNHLGAAIVRGRIYAVGGRPGNLDLNEAYDPLTNTWTTKARMPTGRSGIAVAAVGNFLFAFGGEGNSASPTGIFPQHEAYNADLNSWTMLEPMPTPRHGIGAAVLGNRVYIPGGSPVEGFGTTAQSDFFAVNEDLLLPLVVAGGGYSTSIEVTNPDPARTAEVFMIVSVLQSPLGLTIPPLTSRTVPAIEFPSAGLLVGSARLRSNTRVSAFATIRSSGPPVTIYPATPARNLIFSVTRLQPNGTSTAVAILNPSVQSATVTMSFLRSDTGQEAFRMERTLAAGEQFSRYVHEIFPELQNADFAGTMTVRSTVQLAVGALFFDRTGVITLPVTPIE